MSERRDTTAVARLLPDFCSLPILFALVLVGALTVAVMALAPGQAFDWRQFSTAVAFAVWLALVNGVLLCKLGPLLARLPRAAAYSGVWLLMVASVFVASLVIGWLDHALDMRLTPVSLFRFVLSGTLAAALIGAALLRYFYVVAQWQARQAASARAQVDALQARIRPHFLFNSMNTVAALVRVDPDAAETTVEDLAELFRAALGSEGESSLGEELALIDRYLAIEQLRLGERLRVDRHLDDLPLAMPMPRLLLQPLLENAVVHGIQPRPDGGVIRLHGKACGNVLDIRIGNPLPAGTVDHHGNGHGLDNVRQRLQYHFGKQAQLRVTVDAAYFEIHLRLPGGIHAHPDR
ncbi:MAG TPA: histidine kinase [Oleiagrimonas sp.]|nr:histidine kinase [Oleiagrimonas sp.]